MYMPPCVADIRSRYGKVQSQGAADSFEQQKELKERTERKGSLQPLNRANRRRLPAKYGQRTQSAAALAQARGRASAPPQELALAGPPERGDPEVDGSSTNWPTWDTNP